MDFSGAGKAISGASGAIQWIIEHLIFWRNWDNYSIYVLVGFIFFCYMSWRFIKQAVNNMNSNQTNHWSSSRKRLRRFR